MKTAPRGLPYPEPSSRAASATMRATRRSDTKPEVVIRSLLHAQGVRFRKDFLVRAPGVSVKADIVFTRRRVAVFVDGCFWHWCPQHGAIPRSNLGYWKPKLEGNVARDRLVNRVLLEDGWRVLRIWEHVPGRQAVDWIMAALDTPPPIDVGNVAYSICPDTSGTPGLGR